MALGHLESHTGPTPHNRCQRTPEETMQVLGKKHMTPFTTEIGEKLL